MQLVEGCTSITTDHLNLIKTRPEAGPQDRSEIKKRNREVVAAAQGDVFFLFFRVMVDSKHEERD